ncbi:MAG: putative DNA binding domain-containing protein [Gammaproteobacteria bacterium]|nr:putative DNA binding domain-containing protein [Gammaproteobacteria bacterium]NNJ85192.1 transcriptional regulator [Gammaproteobacteria bacterium]
MLRSELLEIIANGENSGVEFKRDDIKPEKLAKEIVALANLQGGHILLGVEDDGSISGLQRPNAQEWVLNIFRDKVHPQIIPFYEEVPCEQDKRVAVITLSAGISKPYVRRHDRREETFIRMGDRSELATREQQMRLFEAGGLLHIETLPVAGTSFTSLDIDRLDYYLREIMRDPEVPKPEHKSEWIERLLGLGLMAKNGLGDNVCSVAGLLCFGINPKRFLHHVGLRVMAFAGNDKTYQALLDVHLDGPLVGRWQMDDSGSRQPPRATNTSLDNRQQSADSHGDDNRGKLAYAALVDDGVIEKFSSAIGPFVCADEPEIDSRMRRNRIWHYPWEAIREVVINALAHRDWTRSVEIEIAVYSDRFEVISPGRLQNSMTIDKMIAGQRSQRNPMIMDILRDYGYVEARGMGIRTKVIPLMKDLNKTEPDFAATDDYLKTVLFRKAPRKQVPG